MKAKIQEYNRLGFDKLPLCMAKTSNSLTGDPNIKNAPTGFKLDITDIFVSVGAGFVVPMVGEVSKLNNGYLCNTKNEKNKKRSINFFSKFLGVSIIFY